MPRITVALALALALSFVAPFYAQEVARPDVPLEGEAGQTAAFPEVSTFGGKFSLPT